VFPSYGGEPLGPADQLRSSMRAERCPGIGATTCIHRSTRKISAAKFVHTAFSEIRYILAT
jgi:hypothetical protein